MSSAELKQLSRINDKLDNLGDKLDNLGDKLDKGFGSLGGKLDRIANEQRVQGVQLRKLIDGQERLIDGQERMISLLEGQSDLLKALVSANAPTTLGAP